MAKLVAVLFVLAVLAGAAVFGSRGRMTNFDEVNAGVLYRSGQPKAENWDVLVRQYRIRTVISLRENRPGEEWWKQEDAACGRLGLKMVHIPMETRGRPTEQEWGLFYQTVTDPANWPVLVHCKEGSSRTGVMVAGYRIAVMGKSLKASLADAKAHSFEAEKSADYVAFLEGLAKKQGTGNRE